MLMIEAAPVAGLEQRAAHPLAFAATALLEQTCSSVVQVLAENRGAGSGVVWQAGIVLTNYHVVAHSGKRIRLLTAQGRVEARLIDQDPALDLALLELPASGLEVATVRNSSTLRVGELLFAIGHPWGGAMTVTLGIVSGLGRLKLAGRSNAVPYIRSDVLLAPGNSGGSLLDATGAVVGINAMIFGGDLAVAIPSEVVMEWLCRPGRNSVERVL